MLASKAEIKFLPVLISVSGRIDYMVYICVCICMYFKSEEVEVSGDNWFRAKVAVYFNF